MSVGVNTELAVALAASMAEAEELEGVRPGGAPPASKTAVRALVKEKLTEERLKQLGAPDVQCSVCRSVTATDFTTKYCLLLCLPLNHQAGPRPLLSHLKGMELSS